MGAHISKEAVMNAVNATRKRLHTLIDMVDESGLDTLYDVMIRFIPEDEPLPDEIVSHVSAADEIRRGEIFGDDEINWNAPQEG